MSRFSEIEAETGADDIFLFQRRAVQILEEGELHAALHNPPPRDVLNARQNEQAQSARVRIVRSRALVLFLMDQVGLKNAVEKSRNPGAKHTRPQTVCSDASTRATSPNSNPFACVLTL